MDLNQVHPLWTVVAAFCFALLPLLLGVLTSYVKISIVLGMLKSALGTQNVPGNVVVMALSLAMTIFVMGPVLEQSWKGLSHLDSSVFYESPNLEIALQLDGAIQPWKEFLRRHARNREILLLVELEKDIRRNEGHEQQLTEALEFDPSDVSLRVLMPAFLLSELKSAFAMAFILLVPFLVIDLIVANLLVGMGMFMVSPIMISLPLKLVLFVASDGWILLTRSLVHSYFV
jgi:flagellar biosynthesis protein FliP